MRQVELVGPGELNRRRLPLPLTGGLDVAVRNSGPTFVYELKVALRRDDGHRMGLGAAPGARIGVGLETGNIGEPGRGGPGGFAGGGFGGRSGQGGVGAGSGAGGRPERVAPLKVWVRVPLAAGP